MTKRDKWLKPARPPVARYWGFKEEVRLRKVVVNAGDHVTFTVPMPKSWPKTKRACRDGAPHLSTPDVDNFAKGLLDAIYDDDSHIWDLRATKIWGQKGAIKVEKI